jgi:MOSC domain-containing protein YiiM
MNGRIVQINVSPGGVPKRSVPRARVARSGIEGDAHRDTEDHGGSDRALCLFSLERIECLRAEGHPVEPGALGENLTISGLDWPRVQPGDFLRLGDEVLLQVTGFTSPCVNVQAAFLDGAYARVLVPGEIAAGDPVERLTPTEVARHLAVGLGG